MCEIWLTLPDFIQTTLPGAADGILSILKRASRDAKPTLSQVSIELLFRLLDAFALERNSFAPVIYKTLTFLLVEFFWETEIRDNMLKQFIEIIAAHHGIPVAILLEPMLKQVAVANYQTLNLFDFEFFTVVATHRKLKVPQALMLLETLVKIALSNLFYYKSAVNLIVSLINRFSKSLELVDFLKT